MKNWMKNCAAVGLVALLFLAVTATARAENCVDYVKKVRADLRFQWSTRGYAKDLWDQWPGRSRWKGAIPRRTSVMVLDTVPGTGIQNGHVGYVVKVHYNSGARKYEWIEVQHSGWDNDGDGGKRRFYIEYSGSVPGYVKKTPSSQRIPLRGFVYKNAGYYLGK